MDDEPLAHTVLENYLSKLSSLELVGRCYNGLEALNFLHETPVDLMFLDINMPELNGLELLRSLKNPPAVILTTAYSEFALESYEYEVLDYLLKPVRFDRFLKAVNRLIDKPGPPVVEKAAPDSFFFVKVDGIQHKISPNELLFVEAYGNFVRLHLPEKPLLVAGTLTQMEEKLTPLGFLRIHKSYLVNLTHVTRQEGNRLFVGEIELPIGNSYKQVVLGRLGG